MKTLLLLATVLAIGSASVVQFSPTLYTAAIPITTQYHAQDGLGQYSYGYSGGPSAKAEYKSLDGVTRGSYSYVDADGELQTVEYTADSANGFQASATNLPKAPIDDKSAPKPVEDTPEVAMARAEHLAAFREAEQRAAEQPDGTEGESSNGGSQEANSRENNSAETESPSGVESSSERKTEQSESTASPSAQSSAEISNGNANRNGEIPQISNSGIGSLSNGISSLSGLSLASGLDLSSLNGNRQLSVSDLSALSSLQLNGDFSSSLDRSNDAMRFSEITPATTSQLRPFSLTSLRVPTNSYLRVSTPTHGFSIISPSILTAVPTLRATSSQTISRTLPISLSSTFLTQGLH